MNSFVDMEENQCSFRRKFSLNNRCTLSPWVYLIYHFYDTYSIRCPNYPGLFIHFLLDKSNKLVPIIQITPVKCKTTNILRLTIGLITTLYISKNTDLSAKITIKLISMTSRCYFECLILIYWQVISRTFITAGYITILLSAIWIHKKYFQLFPSILLLHITFYAYIRFE